MLLPETDLYQARIVAERIRKNIAARSLTAHAVHFKVTASVGFAAATVRSLTHRELDQLYAEPSVAAYRPEAVIARFPEGGNIAALCFNLPMVPAAVEFNSDYAARLQAVARKLGLPESYIDTIA